MRRMPALRAASALLAASALGLLVVAGTPTAAQADVAPAPVGPTPVQGLAYPGDPTLEAQLVAAEDRRVVEVRSIANAAGWTNVNQSRPYRLATGATYTLVLIRRDAAYSFDDLLELAPSTLVRQPDGSYLLSENIVVEQGATLSLDAQDLRVLRLASTSDAFVSIVTLGGALKFTGTPENPVEIMSWDPVSQAVDTATTDGRAYIRVTGGSASFSHVDFHHLGFWSGVTGGVSLTGTAPPDLLSADVAQNRSAEQETLGSTVFGTPIYPAGESPDGAAPTFDVAPDLDGYSYVSAAIDGITSNDNAFGLFVTNAVGIDIRDSSFEDNLVDGLVLHRGVTNTVVHNTIASRNGVDGVNVSRAATGVILDRVTADANGRNGVRLDGGALADGPSAMGVPTGSYGSNQVANSQMSGNGRYGIEVVGGQNLTIEGNAVIGHQMGIVVADEVADITIKDNSVENALQYAIALRDGVTDAVVKDNTLSGGAVGIFLRDATGALEDNTVTEVNSHAITLIGGVGQSTVTGNTLAGSGPSAVDVSRATIAPVVETNDAEHWRSTKPLDVVLRGIFQPLTVMWLLLGAAVVITALTGLRARRNQTAFRHPYDSHRLLHELSAGEVDPALLGRERSVPATRATSAKRAT